MDGMQILSLVSIAEQQITFFAVAVAAIYLWHDKRKLKRKMLSLEGSNDSSKRPIAIVIGIGNDPLAQVEDFLRDQKIGYSSESFMSYFSLDTHLPKGSMTNRATFLTLPPGMKYTPLKHTFCPTKALHSRPTIGSTGPAISLAAPLTLAPSRGVISSLHQELCPSAWHSLQAARA